MNISFYPIGWSEPENKFMTVTGYKKDLTKVIISLRHYPSLILNSKYSIKKLFDLLSKDVTIHSIVNGPVGDTYNVKLYSMNEYKSLTNYLTQMNDGDIVVLDSHTSQTVKFFIDSGITPYSWLTAKDIYKNERGILYAETLGLGLLNAKPSVSKLFITTSDNPLSVKIIISDSLNKKEQVLINKTSISVKELLISIGETLTNSKITEVLVSLSESWKIQVLALLSKTDRYVIDLDNLFRIVHPNITTDRVNVLKKLYIFEEKEGKSLHTDAVALYHQFDLDNKIKELSNFWLMDKRYVSEKSIPELFYHSKHNIYPDYVVGNITLFDSDEKRNKVVGADLRTTEDYIKQMIVGSVIGKSLVNIFKTWPLSNFTYSSPLTEMYLTGITGIPPSEIISQIKESTPGTFYIDKTYVLSETQDKSIKGNVDLVLMKGKSLLLYMDKNIITSGVDYFTNPPFSLISKYIDHIIECNTSNSSVCWVDITNRIMLSDYELTYKLTREDLGSISNIPITLNIDQNTTLKDALIYKARAANTPIFDHPVSIKYIHIVGGVEISAVYSKNPKKYGKMIDLDYYNLILNNALDSLL